LDNCPTRDTNTEALLRHPNGGVNDGHRCTCTRARFDSGLDEVIGSNWTAAHQTGSKTYG